MIRALIFDCFGVLYHGSLGHLREQLPPDRRQELMDLNMSSDYGYISHEEYVERAAVLIGMSTDELQSITAKQHIRNEPLVNYIRQIKSQYKTALLSNVGSDVMNTLFSPKEQAELFDTVVLSSDVGMTKPNPDIFRLAASQLGVGVEECVMIDDLLSNVQGAEQVGMKAIAYSTIDQMQYALDRCLQDSV